MARETSGVSSVKRFKAARKGRGVVRAGFWVLNEMESRQDSERSAGSAKQWDRCYLYLSCPGTQGKVSVVLSVWVVVREDKVTKAG